MARCVEKKASVLESGRIDDLERDACDKILYIRIHIDGRDQLTKGFEAIQAAKDRAALQLC